MKDFLDVHTHTIASGHAYGTIRDNANAAKAAGLKLLGIADHAPNMPGSCHNFNFLNFKVIPREAYGIKLIMGAELNIIDYSGSTDLPGQILKKLDYAVASLHDPCLDPGSVEENTAALVGVMRNPHVIILGHPDNPQFPVNFDVVARAAKETGVLLEVNNHSYVSTGHRAGSREQAKIMLAACKKYGTAVIMGSDAHIDFDVGNHKNSIAVLEENNFPEEFVVNSDPDRFLEIVKFRKSKAPK